MYIRNQHESLFQRCGGARRISLFSSDCTLVTPTHNRSSSSLLHHTSKFHFTMGRRILKSLRRPREDKPFEVQIEIDDGTPRDEATVSICSTKEQEVATAPKSDMVGEIPEYSTLQKNSSPQQSPAYVPPKIWAEDFDSDSDNDAAQQNACWHLDFGGASQRRNQRRNEIAYAAKNQESRDEHSSDFCGIFDCDVGYHNESFERDVDFLDHEHSIKSKKSRRNKKSNREERSYSSETTGTSVLSDSSCSFDGEIRDEVNAEAKTQYKGGEQEGVEYTLDDMNSTYWIMAAQSNDVDLERKTKKKKSTKRLLKRALKGRKPKRNTESIVVAEDSEDEHTFRSTESNSTAGDATVISIKHVVSSDIDSIQESSDRQAESQDVDPPGDEPTTDDEPRDPPSTVAYDTTPHTSASDESQLPDDERTAPESTDGDGGGVMVNHDIATDQQATNDHEQASPTSIVRSSHRSLYEPLSMGDDRGGSEDEDIVQPTKPVPKTNPPDLLDQVVNAVESLFAFPEIEKPRKRRSKKRVTFAPDVIFNDPYEDYDYSMDYSYDDPEFGEEKFDGGNVLLLFSRKG